jgi:PhoPQ-activated pathogenicity-related protein
MRTALLLLGLLAGCATRPLERYVAKHGDALSHRLVEVRNTESGPAYVYQLRSHVWRGIEWRHWLTIAPPSDLERPHTALLLIDGGTNAATSPTTDAFGLGAKGEATGSFVATIDRVPNQPLFGGWTEDPLIAYTYDKYLEGQGADWPLLLPMVASAVRAMDAIQRIVRDNHGAEIERFVLTGASKRAWTAYLTAAVDDRVVGVAPMVFDSLRLGPQMRQQLESYGEYSKAIQPYTDFRLQERLSTEEGRRLARIVDPYAYRDELDMPKLILLGTNDPYWTVDSANLYYDGLPSPKYLHYSPNVGHGVNGRGHETLLAFYESILSGSPLPELSWRISENGEFAVTWEGPPAQGVLWQASSPTRDFREAEWTPTDLGEAGSFSAAAGRPEAGWSASFIAVRFDGVRGSSGKAVPFTLCTTMYVAAAAPASTAPR